MSTASSPYPPFPSSSMSLPQIISLACASPPLAVSYIDRRTSNPKDLIPLVRLCLTAPLAPVGSRPALRALAVLLCDRILLRQPDNHDALCMKGELLLPFIHYGSNSSYPPREVLQEAYALFDAASRRGSTLAVFLKGRWLLSMEPLHKDPTQAKVGARCVKAAAEANCARALVFMAHRYEYPELDRTISFAADLPKGKAAREKFILSFYKKAADQGDAGALNDIGTSFAEGYGGLKSDFDEAVRYYLKAIEGGSLTAYDNLGTHYETGMGGKFPDKVDLKRALYYYQLGARERCPKCAYNLANAYEEGLNIEVDQSLKKAEKYYKYALRLADDGNDTATAGKCVKDLLAMYITKIKTTQPGDMEAKKAAGKITRLISHEPMQTKMMESVNKAILQALKGRLTALNKLVGKNNAETILRAAKKAFDSVMSNKAKEEDRERLNHILGPALAAAASQPPTKKRARTSRRGSSVGAAGSATGTRSASKRRRTSSTR